MCKISKDVSENCSAMIFLCVCHHFFRLGFFLVLSNLAFYFVGPPRISNVCVLCVLERYYNCAFFVLGGVCVFAQIATIVVQPIRHRTVQKYAKAFM